ncbi:MAG: CBS domain-containing protein [Pseudomonadota bacterium]
MGEQQVQAGGDDQALRGFMKALLNDVLALEHMLENGMFETDVRRIGAEQEFFLVDQARKPANLAQEIMARVDDPRFTFELAKFNLEANLSPLTLAGDCLRRMEREAVEVVKHARATARSVGADIVLTGILPTLGKKDLTLDSMVPRPRYRALNDAIVKLRGGEAFKLGVKGLDELEIEHDNVMLEACNASFQIHFQVAPDEFASLYNIAQAVAGPVLAAGSNSATLLGKRLWHETRIAVFEHSIDARSGHHRARGLKPRVHFGEHWIDQSVLEIFREDIARFRVVLTTEHDGEDPVAQVEAGGVPPLTALRLHNGTVYRWNRACYGITDGKPHLRIEHRALPSGPTVLDEVANAAFFFGLMSELAEEIGDVRQRMRFEDARSNFFAAARYGLKAQFTWLDGEELTANELILRRLLPAARRGLERVKIRRRDIDRYLGVIEDRVTAQQTGARWMLDSMAEMDPAKSLDERLRNLTAAIVSQQAQERPVHRWKLAEFCQSQDWRDSYRTVEQIMTTDLFTVRPDDLIDFAAALMEWKHVRHVPVEDDTGRLVGLVSHRALLRMVARGSQQRQVAVRDIMNPEPTTISSQARTVEAIRLMREHKVACLPVVNEDKLAGVVTEADLIGVAGKLLETFLEEGE